MPLQDENMTKHIFAVRLDEAMKRAGYTQARLAEAAACDQGAISNYKKGRIPAGDVLVRLARALGTTAEALLGVVPMNDLPENVHKQRADAAEAKLHALKAAMSAWLEKI